MLRSRFCSQALDANRLHFFCFNPCRLEVFNLLLDKFFFRFIEPEGKGFASRMCEMNALIQPLFDLGERRIEDVLVNAMPEDTRNWLHFDLPFVEQRDSRRGGGIILPLLTRVP